MRIALLSCSKKKKPYPCPARELYSASPLFSASYAYAKQRADAVYILSSKYGLVHEDDLLEPYEETLKSKNRQEREDWARKVLDELGRRAQPERDEFLILAGETYYQLLLPSLPHHSLPLGKLRMGERLAWLRRETAAGEPSPGLTLHTLANGLRRYTWDTLSEIPFTDGIYLVFETGETYHDLDRIVRVGTHTAQGRLKKRLQDHFLKENHEGSIFRKNVGIALLQADHDPYLRSWTTADGQDGKKNGETEARVSRYLREHCSVAVFPVEEKGERLRLEEAIIATLQQTADFRPSAHWFGRFSTEAKLRESGLWLKQGLDAAPLTPEELTRVRRYCAQSSPCDSPTPAPQPEKAKKPQEKSPGVHGKYAPLYAFLSRQQASQVALSLEELEQILGAKLPPSAAKYPMWWSGHAHCAAWLDAGYHVTDLKACLTRGVVVFTR